MMPEKTSETLDSRARDFYNNALAALRRRADAGDGGANARDVYEAQSARCASVTPARSFVLGDGATRSGPGGVRAVAADEPQRFRRAEGHQGRHGARRDADRRLGGSGL